MTYSVSRLGATPHVVTCSAEDDSGNTSEGTFTVTVNDGVAPTLWFLVAAVYISFSVWQPILYGSFQPVLLASQVVIAVAAQMATRIETKLFQLPLLAIMIVQVAWRGLVLTVGT